MVRAVQRAGERGDRVAMAAALDPDVTLVIDGGGRVAAAYTPVHGAAAVSVRMLALLDPASGVTLAQHAVNGAEGLLLRRNDLVTAVITIAVRGRRATDIWIVVNPDKLRGVNR